MIHEGAESAGVQAELTSLFIIMSIAVLSPLVVGFLRLKVAEIRWGDVTVVAILLLDGPKGLDHSGSLVPG